MLSRRSAGKGWAARPSRVLVRPVARTRGFLSTVLKPFRGSISPPRSRAVSAGAAVLGLLVVLHAGAPLSSRNPGVPPVGKPGELSLGIVAAKCVELQASAPLDHYRFFRFHTDLDFGEAVPSMIVVSGGKRGGSQTYVSRSSHTREVPYRSWRSWLLFVYVPLWCALGLLILLLIAGWLAPGKAVGDTAAIPRWVWVLGVSGLLVLISGYLAGSNFVVDNAMETGFQVQVNGGDVVSLPAGRFLNTRVSGGSAEVKVFAGERVVESANLSLDDSLWDGVVRAFRGRGSFVYNIAAANSYVRTTAGYSAR